MIIQHGGNIYDFARYIGCSPDDVIDFSSNINFIKPDEKIDLNCLDINHYPDIKYSELRSALINHYSFPNIAKIEFFNGGSSAIYSFFRFINLDNCFLYAPIYTEYKNVAKLFKYKINLVNRFKNLKTSIDENSVVIFVNPATPDGVLYNIEDFFDFWKRKNCTILIDESFLDFTGAKSSADLLKQYDKFYILKTFTKFYSCGGVRIGCLISSDKNISALRKYEPPWKISAYDTTYLTSALNLNGFKEKSLSENQKNKKMLYNVLQESGIFEKIFYSSANFLLTKTKDIDGEVLQEKLAEYCILVRVCSNFDFLDNTFVRFTVLDSEKIKFLAKALKTLSE